MGRVLSFLRLLVRKDLEETGELKDLVDEAGCGVDQPKEQQYA